MTKSRKRNAFSLVELVIVIVIIGIIAAIAIPRVSRGSRGAGESSLSSNLSVLRNAIELYASEHNGTYPGHATDGTNAADTSASFISQLTQYSDAAGKTAAARNAATGIIYGPYLRKGIPGLPVGSTTVKNSSKVLIDKTNATPVVGGTDEGWVYNPTTGDIIANSSDQNEAQSKTYDQY